MATRVLRRLPTIDVGGSPSIWSYNLLLLVAGAVLWLGPLRGLGVASGVHVDVPWWALALVFYLADAHVAHVHFRREAHTISLNEIALVAGLYLLSPQALLLAQLTGAGAALAIQRRQRPVKLVFNLAQFTLSTAAAVVVFRAISGLGQPYGPAGWAGSLAAATAASLAGILLVTVAIGIAQGEWSTKQLPATAAVSLVATITTSCIALLGVELGRYDARAFVLLVVPAGIVVFAFQAFVRQRQRHEHLEFLYESMKRTQGAPEFSLAIGQLLIAARHLVRAEYAEIFLFPREGEQGLRSTHDARGEMISRADVLGPSDEAVIELLDGDNSVLLLPAHRMPSAADGHLGSRGIPDGMITTLRGEDGPFGLLVVGDRSGDVDSFSLDDMRLLETFAGHASVLLENGRLERTLADVTELKEQLRHQAYHDILTGLPNRALFAEAVATAMSRLYDGLAAAVLFLDLDDFKAINDSRGHSVGDELLVQVAARVRASIRPGDMPARLGGDEFAVLLEPTTLEGAEGAAERLIRSFAKPFMLDKRETFVHASVGIALASSARSADELLRNADVAMYAAKSGGKKRLAHYEPSMHAVVRKRHELALDLEHAAERGDVAVMFQPIVSLRSGHVVAFEALARWHHPDRGVIEPSEFIPIAEEAGLTESIGQAVLAQACRAARAWRDADPRRAGISVCVNLSPRELTNPRLADEVARTLLESRLDADRLTLEITESAAMRDVDLFSERLGELRKLGVRLALDDFGTGHSSLERLDTLPFTVLKIAKPFVDRLLDASSDTSFVDAFVRLAYSLAMECVAEGIEHAIQVPRLLDRGCGLGQGFFFAPPMHQADIDPYLRLQDIAAANG